MTDTEGCPECGGDIEGDRWEGVCLQCGWRYGTDYQAYVESYSEIDW